MPVLEFSKFNLNDPRLENDLEALELWAFMHYPSDTDKSHSLFSVFASDMAINFFDELNAPLVTLPSNILRTALDAPPYKEVMKGSGLQYKKACFVGELTRYMLLMNLIGAEEPGFAKAAFLVGKANAAIMDEGLASNLPTTKRVVRKYWDEFKPVAHFWAAYVIRNGWLPNAFEDDEEIYYNSHIVSQHFFGTTLRRFLTEAEAIRQAGEQCLASRTNRPQPFLDPDISWCIPSERLLRTEGFTSLKFGEDEQKLIIEYLSEYSYK